jgi:hypothetical protein
MKNLIHFALIYNCIIILNYNSFGYLINWSEEHSDCYTEVMQGSINSTIICRESDYMKIVRNGLKSNNNDFSSSIYRAIFDLYTDLKVARVPYVLNTPQIPNKTILIHPISFCIPEDNIVETIPSKIKPFGQVIPGLQSTNFHLDNETMYFEDMGSSLFTLTYKKGFKSYYFGYNCFYYL